MPSMMRLQMQRMYHQLKKHTSTTTIMSQVITQLSISITIKRATEVAEAAVGVIAERTSERATSMMKDSSLSRMMRHTITTTTQEDIRTLQEVATEVEEEAIKKMAKGREAAAAAVEADPGLLRNIEIKGR